MLLSSSFYHRLFENDWRILYLGWFLDALLNSASSMTSLLRHLKLVPVEYRQAFGVQHWLLANRLSIKLFIESFFLYNRHIVNRMSCRPFLQGCRWKSTQTGIGWSWHRFKVSFLFEFGWQIHWLSLWTWDSGTGFSCINCFVVFAAACIAKVGSVKSSNDSVWCLSPSWVRKVINRWVVCAWLVFSFFHHTANMRALCYLSWLTNWLGQGT